MTYSRMNSSSKTFRASILTARLERPMFRARIHAFTSPRSRSLAAGKCFSELRWVTMFRTVTGLVSELEIDGTMILIFGGWLLIKLREFVAEKGSKYESCCVLVVLARVRDSLQHFDVFWSVEPEGTTQYGNM